MDLETSVRLLSGKCEFRLGIRLALSDGAFFEASQLLVEMKTEFIEKYEYQAQIECIAAHVEKLFNLQMWKKEQLDELMKQHPHLLSTFAYLSDGEDMRLFQISSQRDAILQVKKVQRKTHQGMKEGYSLQSKS